VLDGVITEERLAEAAGRVTEFAAWSGALGRDRTAEAAAERSAGVSDDANPLPSAGSGIGLVAARLAVRVRSAPGAATVLPLDGDPHVVELSPTMNMAVDGQTPWGVAGPLGELRPGTTSVRLTERELAPGDDALERLVLGPATGRALVVVVRDAARHAWMSHAVAHLLRGRPDAVVVEMGVPMGAVSGAVHLNTYGATRVSGIAAAEILTGAAPLLLRPAALLD
jgi:beta-N-acetylhexosaminidase